MTTLLLKWWYSLNYRYCMTEAYLASHRGEGAVSADWATTASGWQLKYYMHGRKLV